MGISISQREEEHADMSQMTLTPQMNLTEYVKELEQAGLLTRYTDEKRVDELNSERR